MTSPYNILAVICTVLPLFLQGVTGAGRMLVPPQRSSLWRDPIQRFNTLAVKNHEDHMLNCGGLWKQKQNEGQCGVCGDPWDAPEPRPNEAGGTYGLGVIGKSYSTADRFIDVMVQIVTTVNGYFEFRLCPNNDIKKKVTQGCLDKNLLKILSSDRRKLYGTRYYPEPDKAGNVSLALEIPEGMTCSQCVLQWKWHGGNNWGQCADGSSKIGCGAQVEFYNCADISIGNGVSSGTRTRLPNKGTTGNNAPMRSRGQSNSLGRQMTPDMSAMASMQEQIMNALKGSNGGNQRATGLPVDRMASMQENLMNAMKNADGGNQRPSGLPGDRLAQSTSDMTPLGMRGNQMTSQDNMSGMLQSMDQGNAMSSMLASMFGQGNGRQPMLPGLSKPMFSEQGMSMLNAGASPGNDLASRLLQNMLRDQNSTSQMKNSMFGGNSAMDPRMLELAMNPNRNMSDYLRLSTMGPYKDQMSQFLPDLLRQAQEPGSSASGQNRWNFNQALDPTGQMNTDAQNLLAMQLMNRQMGDRMSSSSKLQLAGGLGLSVADFLTGSNRQTPGEGGTLMTGSSSRSGGEEASEGRSTSGTRSTMNPQLPLMASLLSGRTPKGSNFQNMFGSGSFGSMQSGAQQMGITPEMLLMFNLLGRNSGSRGGEASEGGGESRMSGFNFGRRSGESESQGGQRGGGMRQMMQLAMMAPLLGGNFGGGFGNQSPRRDNMQDLLRHATAMNAMRGFGDRRSSPFDRNSNLPMLAAMFGGSQRQRMMPNSGRRFNWSNLNSNNGRFPWMSAGRMGFNRDRMSTNFMRNRFPGRSSMRMRNPMSPTVSLLDMYRRGNSMGGRRNSRRMD